MTKDQFMFWHSDNRPVPIKGVRVKQSSEKCTCGATTHDYFIPKKLMPKWRKHLKKTGFWDIWK